MPRDGTLPKQVETEVDTDPVVLALVRAKARIEDPKNWCQFALCEIDAYGFERFCAVGAITPFPGQAHRAVDFLDDICRSLFDGKDIVTVNNTIGHAAVMQVYTHAIAAARVRALPRAAR